MNVQKVGLLLTAVGVLVIVGYYLYGLLIYLFSLDFLPLPVRVAIPLVGLGVIVTMIGRFWSTSTYSRTQHEDVEEVAEEKIGELRPERQYRARQLVGSND